MRHGFLGGGFGRRVAAGAMAIALIASFGCDSARRNASPRSGEELPDQEVRDFVLTETDQGKPAWTLHARYAATYTARNVVVARGVRVDFFGEDGQRSSQLLAREGELNQVTRDMTARGDVRLATSEGTRMATQEMRFLNREQRIVSDRAVRVERSGDVLEGVGFESDPDLKHFEFKSQVRATVRARSGAVLESRPGTPAPAAPNTTGGAPR